MFRCMRHGVATMEHGPAMNCQILGMIHLMGVGQLVHVTGMELDPHSHPVNNGGGLDKLTSKEMGMQPWKVDWKTLHAVPVMHQPQMVFSLNILTTMVSVTMLAQWSTSQAEHLISLDMNPISIGLQPPAFGLD